MTGRRLLAFLPIMFFVLLPASPAAAFIRGDTDGDGAIGLPDVIGSLNYLFVTGTPAPPCLDALDIDDDGVLGLIDPILLANYLFAGGDPPAPPFPDDGSDPTPDPLGDCDAIILPFEILEQGDQSGFVDSSEPGFCSADPVPFGFLLREQTEWEAFWADHTDIFIPPPPLPAVDFSINHVLVVIAAVNTGGYDLDIDSVVEFPDHVEVAVTFVDPEGCGALQVCSQPHQIVLVPVVMTDGGVELEVTTVFPCP